MKEKPLRKFEKETGLKPIIGMIAEESQRREDSWIKTGCNAFDSKNPNSKPMSFWKEERTLEYLKKYKVDYSKVYGEIEEKDGTYYTTGEERTGCIFCPTGCHLDKENKFIRLKRTHPKLHNYCMKPINQGGLGLKEFLDYIGVAAE